MIGYLKKTLVLAAFAVPSVSLANQAIVPADNSAYSQVCVVAATAPEQLDATIAEHNVDPLFVRCNGLPLDSFVAVSERAGKSYALAAGDNSAFTEVCMTAAANPDRLDEVAAEAGIKARELRLVECNGQQLTQFVRRFGS